jgi:RNA polymerase sigma factor (sigma-70 family)
VSSDDIYAAHRAVIDWAIAAVCRRQSVSNTDVDEFASVARLHLLADDCRVLRQFKGHSSIKTFLFSVIAHVFQDWRNAQWGKWRASAAARRTGPIAVHLERLIQRDGLSVDEACQTLKMNPQVTESHRELEDLAARLPGRPKRTFLSDSILNDRPAREPLPDVGILERQAASSAQLALRVLKEALRVLAPLDQLVLKMRFEDGLTVAQIARGLSIEQKLLYRRIEGTLRALRSALERQGVDATRMAEILAGGGMDIAEMEIGPRVRLHDASGSPHEGGRVS